MKQRVMTLLLCFASGCASGYAYAPTTNATTTIHGRPAAEYAIPTAAPEGDVRLASYGITTIKPEDNTDALRALHLRIILTNNGSAPWTFDTRDQKVVLDGHGTMTPAFASANAGSAPPAVSVEPGAKRTVDLFFLLPPGLQQADEIPAFDALWNVGTDRGLVAERTPFERLVVEPDYDGSWAGEYYGPGYYWSGPYWVNPAFPYDGVPHPFVGARIVIRRAPHIVVRAEPGRAVRRQRSEEHVHR